MELKSYYFLAEDMRLTIFDCTRRDIIRRSVATLAQKCCLFYLKHIVKEYYEKHVGKKGNTIKEGILNRCKIAEVIELVSDTVTRHMSDELKEQLSYLDKFYVGDRYDLDKVEDFTAFDIRRCLDAVVECKRYVDIFIFDCLV